MIGPESTPSSTKCTVTPVIRDPVLERLADRVEARERRQQRRVDVDHPVRRSGARTPARAAACSRRGRRGRPRAPSSQSAIARSRASRSAYSSAGKTAVSTPAAARPLERPRLGLVGADRDDLDPVAAVQLVEDRLQVGPGARGEHRRRGSVTLAARRRRSFGKRPPVERSLPGVDQRVDLAQQRRRRASRANSP